MNAKDFSKNNILHYAYLTNNTEIIECLKVNKVIKEDQKRRNGRGRLPKELRHAKKTEDSADSDS